MRTEVRDCLLPFGAESFVFQPAIQKFRVIISRMRWAGHVARMGERIGVYKVLVGNLREKNHMEAPGVDGRIILCWIFRK